MAEKFQRIEDIKQAVEVMNQGGIILYPTDTIWGIGCDATNETAVRRIFEIKQRADSKALITLVDSEAKIPFYVKDVPDVAWDLIECTEKPLTIIYDHGRNLAANLAIVSTSANISGKPSPQYFNDISENVKQAVDYICTSRQQEKEIRCASSIIKLSEGSLIKIIRE